MVHLLRSSPPQSFPEEFIEENMCIPVFPNTEHPSRMPITPSHPLPDSWAHCYHASFETVILRVPLVYVKFDLPIRLPLLDRAKHNTAIREDTMRRERLMLAAQPKDASIPLVATHVECTELISIASSSDSCISRGRTHSVTSPSGEAKSVPPPVAVMSYNLATLSTLSDPQDLIAEIRHIEKYVILFESLLMSCC